VDENALERDLLVEHTLSMIERVADGNEYGSAREFNVGPSLTKSAAWPWSSIR
jgi:hypothetical protein